MMRECKMHTFQVLTKRAERLSHTNALIDWPDNVWMGVSVENQKVVKRIELLSRTNAKVKFLSCEPLIGPLPSMNLSNIDWVIVGGESDHRPRPMDKAWVIDIKKQCHSQNILFFFKQWGGTNKKKSGRELDGSIYNEMPEPTQAIDI